MPSIARNIESTIETFDRGRIFFADDFTGLASPETIRQTLLRLSKTGKIIRIAQGIYCRPEIDDRLGLGVIYPTLEQIAEAVAEHNHARIVPTGEYALNVLGLSTQIPMNFVYLTDGPSRTMEISGGRGITFRNTAPQKPLIHQSARYAHNLSPEIHKTRQCHQRADQPHQRTPPQRRQRLRTGRPAAHAGMDKGNHTPGL